MCVLWEVGFLGPTNYPIKILFCNNVFELIKISSSVVSQKSEKKNERWESREERLWKMAQWPPQR